jgi:HD domain
MRALLSRVLLPPQTPDYERTQKSKLLHVALIAVLLASLAIAAINFDMNALWLAGFLCLLAAFCAVGLYLNHAGHLNIAALILCTLVFIGMFYNLVDGAALHDPGVAAFPIFIVCASFFFGKKAIPLSTLLSMLAVGLVFVLGEYGVIKPAYPPTWSRVLILWVLYGVLASLTWALRDIWDSTLAHLKQSYDLTLQGWARALEYRDGETEGHSRRVTALCVELAQRLGCSEEDIIHIRRGAYMHDIGKMAIPDRVLFKPGPLDADERALMNQHPLIAFKIVSEIPFLQPALAIPYSHHENWDGSGYPQGLKGTDIPLIARMFTVVDHWDALSSDRPYRKAWPQDEIVAHLQTNAGKIYDPQIVAVFLALVSEGGVSVR